MTSASTYVIADSQVAYSYKRIWIIAFSVGVVGAIPVVLFKDQAPWLIAVPISIGILLGIGFEVKDYWLYQLARLAATTRSPELVAALGAEHKGLVDYVGRIALELRDLPEKDKDQSFFPFLRPNRTPRKRVHRVTLKTGEQINIINCDRFVDALVTALLQESDKVVEHSLAVAAKRFGQATPDDLVRKGFLTKTIVEAMKADFRGNWIAVVSRTSEKVLQRFDKEVTEVQLESPK